MSIFFLSHSETQIMFRVFVKAEKGTMIQCFHPNQYNSNTFKTHARTELEKQLLFVSNDMLHEQLNRSGTGILIVLCGYLFLWIEVRHETNIQVFAVNPVKIMLRESGSYFQPRINASW